MRTSEWSCGQVSQQWPKCTPLCEGECPRRQRQSRHWIDYWKLIPPCEGVRCADDCLVLVKHASDLSAFGKAQVCCWGRPRRWYGWFYPNSTLLCGSCQWSSVQYSGNSPVRTLRSLAPHNLFLPFENQAEPTHRNIMVDSETETREQRKCHENDN